MTTSLKESFDRAHTDENLTPVAAGSAASEQAFGGQNHAEDCAVVAGITFAESPFEKSNSRGYHSEKKRMNVQHFLQAAAVIIGTKRHRFRINSHRLVSHLTIPDSGALMRRFDAVAQG